MSAAKDALLDIRPDILCLQEVRDWGERSRADIHFAQFSVHPKSFGKWRGKPVGRKDEEPSLSWIWNQRLPVSSDTV
jgi:hypothetical protein